MLTIAGVGIGGGNPCRFVAEISCNHGGDFDRCLRLIDAAKAAGADFLKTQCYTPDELVALRGDGPAPEPWGSQGWTMRTLYEKAQTPHEWFPRLVQHCRNAGLPWFSSVFGAQSLDLLWSLDCSAYKVARLDNNSDALKAAILARGGKPILISEENWFESAFRLDAGWRDVERLYCPRGYPPANIKLPFFQTEGYDHEGESFFIGLSSHCLAPELPVAAVARGCKLIEMHFQLDDEPSELEANVSLTASKFEQMVLTVRRVEAMLG